jgi:subtilisin family serine protease
MVDDGRGTGMGVGQVGETTGRHLVMFATDGVKDGMKALGELGVEPVRASAMGEDADREAPILFDKLGVAVVDAPPEQLMAAAGGPSDSGPILAIEPERVVYALETEPALRPWEAQDGVGGGRSADYLRGYRDAVLHLTGDLGAPAAAAEAGPAAGPIDETQTTWGLQAVKAMNSCYTGKGIRVAVLDTGFDMTHPDFAGRTLQSRSFIPGQQAQDGHGHGTHCIGTAAGSRCPATRPRYGVAVDAEIYAGKVLSNSGSGTDSQILGGINWAIQNRCVVISMSLGAPSSVGQRPSAIFEHVASRAASAGSLIIAAAGNDSARPNRVSPVSHPANCPSILAVAAVNSSLGIAPFSNRGINPGGGQIDLAGPGVDVYSSWPMPRRYRRLQGTSMATPHAAGVAALHAEADPAARGMALASRLASSAQRLTALASADVGAGLVQAP